MTAKNLKKILPLFLLILLTYAGYGSPFHESAEKGKEVYVQRRVRNHPDFSMERTAESENFVIFWGAKINGDPRDMELNEDLWFDPDQILEWSEDFFIYSTDTMKFLDPQGANTSRYKFEIVMNETWTEHFKGWAFGSAVDKTIGSQWTHPRATRTPRVLVHEIVHGCQGMVSIDNPGYGFHAPYSGFFWESHANWASAIYFGDRGSGMLQRFINTSMMHYSNTRRHYQNFAFLDWVADRHGIQTVNDIWHKSNGRVDHPMTSFRDSIMNYTQDELNDDLLRSAMSNVTWNTFMQEANLKAQGELPERDLSRLYTIPDPLPGLPDSYIVPEYLAPGDYGYNIIKLYPDEGAREVTVGFEGLENEPAGGAGSRYGFVAVGFDGEARYSDIYRETDREATFRLTAADSAFFLIVTGAPGVHHNYEWEVGYTKNYRYPYIIRLSGAKPVGHTKSYNCSRKNNPGAPHPNGGGWVSSYAAVSMSAWVGPDAQVLKNAIVTGNARIEGYAVVTDSATVRGDAVVKDHAMVTGNSIVEGNALVQKSSMVYNTALTDNAVVSGSAILNNSSLSGSAVARDLAWLNRKELSGTAIVGGDAESINNISEGTYYDNRRRDNPDGRIWHDRNIDVNPYWPQYQYPMGSRPSRPGNIVAETIGTNSIELAWEASEAHSDHVEYYVLQETDDAFEVIGVAGEETFSVKGLQGGTEYVFVIQAKDRSGNLSEPGAALSVKTAPVISLL